MQKFVSSILLVSCLFLVPNSQTSAASDHAPPAPPKETPKKAYAEIIKKLKVGSHETALFVGDMHCKTCAKKVAGKLYSVKGVKKVRTNVKDDVAIITPQKNKKLDITKVWKAAQAAGFPPVKLIGPQGNYVADPKTKSAIKQAQAKPTPTKQG